jgi:hypothetical protein
MTDPTAPPPIEPGPPEYDPGNMPDEEPMRSPPTGPGDDRPYDAASSLVSTVTSYD